MNNKNREKNLVKFKKGKSGNPKGRPRVKGALKDIKEQIGDNLEKYINEMLCLNQANLKEIVEDKTGRYPAFKQTIASILFHSIKYGDPSRLEALLSRVIGKVKDVSERKHLFENLPELKLRIIKNNEETII